MTTNTQPKEPAVDLIADVKAQRFQLPTAPHGEVRDFAVLEVRADAQGTTYVLVEADTLRFDDRPSL